MNVNRVLDNGRSGTSRLWTRRVMAAACVAAAMGLGACESSMETAHEAQRDAEEAARISASAGEPRGTDALMSKVKDGDVESLKKQVSNPDSAALRGQLVSGLVLPTKDKDLTAALEELTVKDLEKANAAMTRALNFHAGAALDSAFHGQAGDIAMQLSAARFQAVQGKLLELTQRATALQLLAETAMSLGAEAKSLAANSLPPAMTDVNKARENLNTATQATQQAQTEVARIQKEISDRQAQARQIYQSTDAAFQAADAMKGQAAIDAAKKAATDRKKAEDLTEQAGNLDPTLGAAQRALAMAQIQQQNAEMELAGAQAAFDAASQVSKQKQDRVAALRQAAGKIVSDPEGIAAQNKALIDLSNQVDTQLAEAAKAAEDAQKAFGRASSSASTAQSELKTLISDKSIDAKDPLTKISNDARPRAILSWKQAAALDQIGRINLAGQSASRLAGGAATQVAASYEAAGMPADAAAKPAGNPDTYKAAAQAAFTSAVTAADTGMGLNSEGMNNIKWIGAGLKAISQQGLAQIADAAGAKKAMDDAKDTARDALARNPDLRVTLQRLTLVQ